MHKKTFLFIVLATAMVIYGGNYFVAHAVSTPTPDLTFAPTSSSYTPQQLTVAVLNIGTAKAAGNLNVLMFWLDSNGNKMPVPFELEGGFGIQDIEKDSAVTKVFTPATYPKLLAFNPPPPGAVKLLLVLDNNNKIAELNEANNDLKFDAPDAALFESPSAPDLTIGNVTYTKDEFTVEIKNIGTGMAKSIMNEPLTVLMFWLDSDGKQFPQSETQDHGFGFGGIPGGVSLTKTFTSANDSTLTVFNSPPSGAVKLRLVLDIANSLKESNEDNNEKIIDALPTDLYMSSLVVTNEGYNFTYGNSGNMPSGIGFKLQWYDARGDPLDKLFQMTSDVILAPGQTETAWGNYSGENSALVFALGAFIAQPPEGAVSLGIQIYSKEGLAEINEENNYIKTYYVSNNTTAEELIVKEEGADIDEIAEEVENPDIEESDSANTEKIIKKYDPAVLPGNPFYAFKSAARAFGTFFAFSKEKKAERKLKYAGEKIVETARLLEKGKTAEAFKHLENYNKEMKEINNIIETLKIDDKEKAEKLSERAFKSAVKHQTVIGKLEKAAPAEILTAVKDERGKALGEIGRALGNTGVGKRMDLTERAFDNNGSPFKPLRNIEILKALAEKVPEEARGALERAQENSLNRFSRQMENLPNGRRELLEQYAQKAGGDDLRNLDTLEDLRGRPLTDSVRKSIDASAEKIYTRVKDIRGEDAALKQIEEKRTKIQESKGSVPNRIEEKTGTRDRNSLSAPEKPGREVLCTQEYNPVCGVDGKTYSNRCVAERQNSAKVAYDGACRRREITPQSRGTSSCSTEYIPVCGTDKATYGNECRARVAGVSVLHKGVCRY